MSTDSINRLQVNYAPNATTDSVTATTDSNHLIQNVDIFYRQGYRKNYSIRDAAVSLWRQEIQGVNPRDPKEQEKATEDEAISHYIQNLRQNGLDGTVNWSAQIQKIVKHLE